MLVVTGSRIVIGPVALLYRSHGPEFKPEKQIRDSTSDQRDEQPDSLVDEHRRDGRSAADAVKDEHPGDPPKRSNPVRYWDRPAERADDVGVSGQLG